MHAIMSIVLALAAFVSAWKLTLVVEAHAHAAGLIQTPNQRSSHTSPTPSGGGIAIAASSVVTATIIAICTSDVSLLAIVAFGSAAAVLGFVDDLRDLSVRLRLLAQLFIMCGLIWVAWWVAPPTLPFDFPGKEWIVPLVLVFASLWWINLFNFMDGIDGIAASQAILIIIAASILCFLRISEFKFDPLIFVMTSTAAATGGFLLRNWPPAHIFMGDAGSNFLAVVIFAFALLTIGDGTLSIYVWLILGSPFVCDATVTILRRTARGETPWSAHRRHAYQHLSRKYGHAATSIIFLAIFLIWSFPLSILAHFFPEIAYILFILCYVALSLAAYLAGGGSALEGRGG